MAQWLEHCVSSAKVVGSIPRETHVLTKKKCIASMHCKSLWIKASAKCINVNAFQGTEKTVGFSTCFQFVISIIRCSGLRSKPYVKYIFYFSAKWLSSSEGTVHDNDFEPYLTGQSNPVRNMCLSWCKME